VDRTRAEITKGFLSLRDYAEVFGVKQATIQRWVRDGSLPAVRLGRLTLIPKDALERLVERQEGSNASR